MCRSTFPMDRRRSQYRSPRRTSRRRVAAIFCLATHCLGWRVLPFMDFYDQKPTVYLHEFVRSLMRSSSGRAPAADYNAKRNRIIDLQILEENASKLQNYCYDEKNFKVPVIEQVLDVIPILRLSDLRLPNRGGRWT